jgi:hypothetical protein
MCGKALPFRQLANEGLEAPPQFRGIASRIKSNATESQRLSAHQTAEPLVNAGESGISFHLSTRQLSKENRKLTICAT